MSMPANYYERFDASKNYEEHLFLAGLGLQSAELNEIQKNAAYRLRGVADVLFKNGAIVRDCSISVNPSTGVVTCDAGAVYANGAVRSVAASSLTIAVNTYVAVGVRLIETVVDDSVDPLLRDPAPLTRNYDSPGAQRLKIDACWAHSLDSGVGEFFAIYDVYDGIVSPKEAPPQIDAVSMAIQKYDQDSTGGTYSVSGLVATSVSQASDSTITFRVGKGSARINGRSIDLVADRSYTFDAAPDLKLISSEPHLSATDSIQRIDTDFSPVSAVTLVSITEQKTVTMIHGVVTGASDLLPDTSVLSLISVSQGGTTYTVTTDYLLTSGSVNWSPAGAEPAPGSSYSVTYQYIHSVAPTSMDSTGFSVTGAVTGTLVMATYQYKVPRIDRLCINASGVAALIRGTPSVDFPNPPSVPKGQLLLATIRQSWTGSIVPVSDGVRMVSMETLNSVNTRLDRMVALIAKSRLESNIAGRDASLKKSIFVDPFFDDSMRDAGVYQTAAVFGGLMTLPIYLTARYFASDVSAPTTLPPVIGYGVTQDAKTSTMKVNPYDSFSPIPAKITLSPSVDQMTYSTESWTSNVTSRVVVQLPYGSSAGAQSSETIATVSSSLSADQVIRPQYINFALDGFGAGETLSELSFDNLSIATLNGSSVATTLVADSAGHITGQFRIPQNIAVGTKQVQFLGSGGSYGVAYFAAASWQENKTLQRVVTEYVYQFDPPPVVVPDPPIIIPDVVVPPVDPVDPPPPSAPLTYVEELYDKFLGRVGEPAGLAYWNAELVATNDDRAKVTKDFLYAAAHVEYTALTPTAVALYTGFFGALPCTVDPIAQTFLLSQDAQIIGVDLWFSAVGTSDVMVQIRTVSNGFPTRTGLAECRKKPADISVDGTHTTFSFDAPLFLSANEEVAIVVLCNDAVTQVDIAEIGKWNGSSWVTEQPYTVGVLLSSSNALTWTAHQDRDLRFRIVNQTYSGTSLTVNLGSTPVEDVTDLMVMGLASKPTVATDVTYRLTLPGGAVKTVSANAPINLTAAITGDVLVEALLTGSSAMSPVLFQHGQLAFGWLSLEGDYVSRAMTAGTGSRIHVIVEAQLPTGSSLNFYWKGIDSGDTWSVSAIPQIASVMSDGGFVEVTYEVTGVNEDFIQVKAVLAGTAAARPYARNLRVMVL
jgi:hypothetical protein